MGLGSQVSVKGKNRVKITFEKSLNIVYMILNIYILSIKKSYTASFPLLLEQKAVS